MTNFSGNLGAGTRARRLCRGDEQLLWAANGRVFYYDVDRLDPHGAPAKNALRRGFGAVGRFAGDFAEGAISDILFDSNDASSDDRPPPPDVLAFGPAPDCVAHRHLKSLQPIGGPG